MGTVRVTAENALGVSPSHGESDGRWEKGYSSLLRESAAYVIMGETEPRELREVCESNSYFLWSMYVNKIRTALAAVASVT